MVSLVGTRMPDIALPSTDGSLVNLSLFAGRVVVFVYPYTGEPGIADPPGWDNIPGAHGSTPQALGFSKLYDEFAKLHVSVAGLSFQHTDWQRAFVIRNGIRFPLLSDDKRDFAKALGLDTFKAGDKDYLVRRALVSVRGSITHDFYPVHEAAHNAQHVLKVLQS